MEKAIDAIDISKSFHMSKRRRWSLLSQKWQKEVFQNLSFHIFTGETVAFCGNNGSGKTTLMKLIAGYLRPSSGIINLFGIPSVFRPGPLIGMMLPNQFLNFNLTGRENLEFTARLFGVTNSKNKIGKLTQIFRLESILDEPVEVYSSGQRGILSVVRALVTSPPLLILDEPFAFLDQTNTDTLRDYLKSSSQTIVMTTQRPEQTLGLAHRIIELS